MKQIVFEVLQTITQRKKDAKQYPDFVLDIELKKVITERTEKALRELWRERKLQVGRTVNHNYIELIKDSSIIKRNEVIHKK